MCRRYSENHKPFVYSLNGRISFDCSRGGIKGYEESQKKMQSLLAILTNILEKYQGDGEIYQYGIQFEYMGSMFDDEESYKNRIPETKDKLIS